MKEYDDHNERMESILEAIGQMASLDFSGELETDDSDDQLNAIAQGLNWLREELQNNMVEKSRLEEINQKLELLIEENEGMMHMMVHDLKAPINNIKILSDIITDDDGKEEINFEYLNREVKKAKQIINELNYYHKLEHADVQFESERMEITQLIEQLVSDYQGSAEEKSIQLDFNTDLDGIEIESDKLALTRIFDNLVSNAIKFSPFETKVEVSLSRDNGDLILGVKDEGPGMTKMDKAKLFKRFQMLSARPTNNEVSTGLGLAIVKLLTDKLGYTIEVESEEGKGTTFTIRILTKTPEQELAFTIFSIFWGHEINNTARASNN